MGFDRTYSAQEVHDILCESERRNKPGGHHPGHSIGLHADGRDDVTDRRFQTRILLAETLEKTRAARPEDGVGDPIPPHMTPIRDGAFVSRVDLIRAVRQALNSAEGQAKLRTLNPSDGNKSEVRFTYTFGHSDLPCDARAARHASAPGPNNKPVLAIGPPTLRHGVATAIFLYIVRIDPPTAGRIHIQTAYPTDVR